MTTSIFDRDCRACPRLAEFLDEVSDRHPDYYCRPVPPFGASDARLLVVGLAPGMHGANRTGRPFTGDHAGILLYQMLHKHGFSSRPHSGQTSLGASESSPEMAERTLEEFFAWYGRRPVASIAE